MTDAIVVGAGVAGLACAAALRAAGRDVVVLEASGRIGGRAYTTTPAVLHGAAFDHGASWLHAADRNPLLPIAQAAGESIIDSDSTWTRQVMVDGRKASLAELAAYDRAEARFEHLVHQAAATHPDVSMAEAVTAMQDNPWLATIESFEATLIAAADSRSLSVRDAFANSLAGRNLNIAGGLGAFVARRLAQPALLDTPVRRIAWDGAGVAVETARGTLRARTCVVTVSTGVLRAGDIAFDPPLPDPWRTALDGLPMGVLTKIGLGAAGEDRLDLPDQCSLRGRLAHRHAAAMSFVAWPRGEAHLVGFLGGTHAAALSAEGPRAVEAFARAELRALLGAEAATGIGGAVVADWAADRWHRGAYAYALSGRSDARQNLAEPLAGGRLRFAGEAVATAGLAGTVGGAFASGRDTAGRGAGHAVTGLRAVLARPAFVRLWIAGGIGNAMLWLEVLAAGLFTAQVTGSALMVAIVSAARSLPLLAGAVVGVLAEAYDRKRIVVGGLLLAATASASVAALSFAGVLRPWHLALAALASGCVYATEMPARRRLVAESAGPAEVERAVALDSLTNFATRCAGPLAGGAAYGLVGIGGTFAASAALSFSGALLVSGIAHTQTRRAIAPAAVWRDLAEGFAFARGRAALLALLGVTVTMNLFGYSYTTLMVPIGRDAYHLTAARVGILAAAEPAGAFLCGLVTAAFVPRGRPLYWLAGGVALLLTALAGLDRAAPLWPACLVLLGGGIGSAFFTNAQTMIVMIEAPPAMRSRVMGLVTVCIGTWPLGMLLGGGLTQVLSPLAALTAMALGGLAALAGVLAATGFSRRAEKRRTRRQSPGASAIERGGSR